MTIIEIAVCAAVLTGARPMLRSLDDDAALPSMTPSKPL
jgi:hypothetical protein